MNNREALSATLSELKRLGRFERIDTARIQALRSMAESLDYDPSNAALWGRYLSALNELLEADRDADSALTSALKKIRSDSPVGDSTSS